jgi:amidohydrolase
MSLDLADLYRDLHAHPELAFVETRTAALAARLTADLGLTVTTGVGGTGVVAVLENGDGPVVALRADMDALPVAERTGLDYASTVTTTGPDGVEVPVMHACGHDMHVTWLVGAVEDLVARRDTWSGTLVAVFQPAEEQVAGARAMVDDGLLERFPRPDVVLGQHVAPFPAGVVALRPGPAMAGSDTLTVTFHGRGGHGSRPQTTVDPLLAACHAVVRLQSIVSRESEPGEVVVVSVGTIQAGTADNVVPAEATLGINVRTVTAQSRTRVLGAVRRIVEAEAAAAGMTTPPTVVESKAAPATVNDPDATDRVRSVFREAFGEGRVLDPGMVTGSEDVGTIATAADVPLVFWFVGGTDPATYAAAAAAGTVDSEVPSNHSPFFAPVLQPTLDVGVATLSLAAREWFGR